MTRLPRFLTFQRFIRGAVFLILNLVLVSICCQADTCSYTYTCHSDQCKQVMGGYNGTRSATNITRDQCEAARKATILSSTPCVCTASGNSVAPVSTGSAAGDLGYALGQAAGKALGQLLFGRPKNTPDPAWTQAHFLNDLGNQAYADKQWEAARKNYADALAYQPNDTVIRSNLAGAQNQLGIEAYRKNEFALAKELFEMALRNSPDKTIQDNLDAANRQLQIIQQREEAERRERVARDNMQGQVNALVHTLAPFPQTRLAFARADSVPSGPSQSGSQPPGRGSEGAALYQLRVAAGEAADAAGEGEPASRKPFDTPGNIVAGLANVATPSSQPVVPPAYQKAYGQLEAEKGRLQQHNSDVDKNVAEIQQKLDQGQGNRGELLVELAKGKQEKSNVMSAIATQQIKEDDLTGKWEEEDATGGKKAATPEGPAPAASTTSASAPNNQ